MAVAAAIAADRPGRMSPLDLGSPNREQRRHLSTKQTPGSVPVKVSHQVPVTMIAGADGRREVVDPEGEPCYACACCVQWTSAVDKLRTSMVEHEDGEHADCAPTVFPGCLVCQLLAGVADG